MLLIVITLSIPVHATVEIIAGPYVQNVGNDCATIMWKTNIKTEKNVVYWGNSYKLINKTVAYENTEWHEVKLDGLKH